MKNGEGNKEYSNRSRYDGMWVNDARQGYGEYVEESERYYKGQWKNDF